MEEIVGKAIVDLGLRSEQHDCFYPKSSCKCRFFDTSRYRAYYLVTSVDFLTNGPFIIHPDHLLPS